MGKIEQERLEKRLRKAIENNKKLRESLIEAFETALKIGKEVK